MDDTAYKSRTQGAVGSERMTLLCIIAHYWDDLERYENEGGTQRQKWDLWETIASEFNNHPNVSVIRTPLQVKTLFKNMKTKARKYKQKLEESKTLGIIVEPDPISETVLKLNKYQSRESLDSILQPLKSLYYLSRESHLGLQSLKDNHQLSSSSYLNNSSSSLNFLKISEEENNHGNYEEELEENVNNPCNIEDGSSSFPPANSSSYFSEDDLQRNISQPLPSGEEPSQVHTFGDISVTPISGEKRESLILSRLSSPAFRISNGNIAQESSSLSIPNIDSFHNQQSTALKRTNNLKRLYSALENDSPQSTSSTSFNNTHSHNSCPSGGCSSSKHCCCPEYHNEMVAMALKEHEMKVTLLSEEILCQRAERSFYEEERRIREQNFLFKQEERQDAIAEHQARMKVIELECEALEERIKTNDRTNKWFLCNGSKEI